MPLASLKARITSGLSGSPAATSVRTSGSGGISTRLAITRYSVGAMQSTVTCSSRRIFKALRGVETGIVEQRRGAPDPRRDEHVARRFGPAGCGGAPDQVALAGVQPVLGLEPLPEQVALAMHDSLGFAGGPARERDQARIGRVQVDVLDGRPRPIERRIGNRQQLAPGCGRLELRQVALVGHDQLRLSRRDPQAQVLGPQLLVARQRDRSEAEARDHRQHPLGPVADHRHHGVSLRHAVTLEGGREAGASVRDLAERPLPALALAGDLDQRQPVCGGGVDQVSGEVHGGVSLPGSRPVTFRG